MFKNWDWADVWQLLGLLSVIALGILIGVFVTSDKSTIKYSVGADHSNLRIVREINWSEDEYISVDRTISLDSVVKIVNNLNNNLKKITQ